jgi:hypothetical protein
MYKAFVTFYWVNKKIVELELSAEVPPEKSKKNYQDIDKALQAHSSKISSLLSKLPQFKKIGKGKVYLCMAEIEYDDKSQKFEGAVELELMSEKPEFEGMTPTQFSKVNGQLEKKHIKKLAEEEKQDKLNRKKGKKDEDYD